jgi:hypothetical protein
VTGSLSAAERETIVTLNDEEPFARVWTAQRRQITRLKRNPAATLIEEGKYGSTAWADFTVPAELFAGFRSRRLRRPGQAPPPQKPRLRPAKTSAPPTLEGIP